MILSAIPLGWRLGVAAVGLAAAAYGGWYFRGHWDEPDLLRLQRKLDNATQIAAKLLEDQGNSRTSLAALQALVEACQARTAESQAREAVQLEQKRKARPVTPANATRQDVELIDALNAFFAEGR